MFRKVLFWLLRRLLPAALRIKLYRSLWDLSVRIYGTTDWFAQRAPFNLFLKFDNISAAQEVLSMRLVAKHTDIPIPEVLDQVGSYIVMTRLEGELLGELFCDMPEDEVLQVRRELRQVVQQLRGILRLKFGDEAWKTGQQQFVSGPLSHVPCCDVNRMRLDTREFGPFPNFAAFHSYLIHWFKPGHPIREKMEATHDLDAGDETTPRQGQDEKSILKRAVFTHGDLHLRNILVKRTVFPKGHGSTVVISGVLDWTCAGWFPVYWEHGKAIWPYRRFKLWTDLWDGIAEDTIPAEELPRYMEEFELEKEIWPYMN